MLTLTKQEVRDLSGYQRPSKQIEWLKRHGIRFMVAADGYPRVLRKDLESKENQQRKKPNFAALAKLGTVQ